MKTSVYIIILIVVAVSFFFIGSSIQSEPEQKNEYITTAEFEKVVKKYPPGELNIPAQWFMMEGLVGWEKMMLIFGYADNKTICEHLKNLAVQESPERNFKCQNAN